jgi:hypothetical protein
VVVEAGGGALGGVANVAPEGGVFGEGVVHTSWGLEVWH